MTHDPKPGDSAPEFLLASTAGDVSLEGMLAGGRRLVLAFYFEDGTPSCETEIRMLRDSCEMIDQFRARVLAVSSDSVESHTAFVERFGGVPFPLASDPSLNVARSYGVVDEGDPKRSRRAVFVIDTDKTIMLAVAQFQPNNLSQIEAIFGALDAEE